ncbi:copper chaperone [Gordonia sp. NPDC003424]
MTGAVTAEMSVATARGRSWMSELRSGRQPQWPAYAVAAVGWSVLVALEIVRLRSLGSTAPVHVEHAVHAGHDMSAGMAESGSPGHGVSTHVVGLLAMLAVMTPLVASDARYTALRAPSGYRRRVPGWVLTGWAVGWVPLLASTAVVTAVLGLAVERVAFGEALLLIVFTVAAVVWQWTPRKRLSLARCHRVLAPPLARHRARITCLRYGVGLGNECGISCAPMMMVMMIAAHSVYVVAPLTALAWYERRRRPHHDPGRLMTSVILALVGGIAAGAACASLGGLGMH